MHGGFNNDFGGNSYNDNQSEAYGDENESSSDKRYGNNSQKGYNDPYHNQNQNSGQGVGRNKGGQMYQGSYDQ